MDITPQQLADIAALIEHRELERARAQAQELLRLHPTSAPVHALLGDAAAARDDHREAVDWYELALRLQNSPAVAARLDRQRALLNRESEAEIDQLLQPRDNRRRLMLAIIGGFAAVALIILLIASLTPHHRPVRHPAAGMGVPRPAIQAGAPQAPATTPLSPPVTAGGRPETATLPRPEITSSSAPGDNSGRPLNITRSVDAPMSARDRWLTQGLSGLTWPNGEALTWRVLALVDDFTGYAMVTVEMPPAAATGDISGLSIDMSYKLAVATIQADKGVQSMTIRILMDADVDGKTLSLLAFRGNTTRDNLDYYLKRGIQPDRQTIWDRVFATTWWNPSVPSGAPQPTP